MYDYRMIIIESYQVSMNHNNNDVTFFAFPDFCYAQIDTNEKNAIS